MKQGGRVMLAVLGGYVLGRTKKMKLAIMLAGMASGNKIARDPTQLLQQSARLVQSSPQLSALSDHARARLIEAGKGIAVAVVSKQMESLSDRLSERTERLGGRLDERIGSLAARVGGSGRAADDDEAEPADEDHAEDPADGNSGDQTRVARRAAPPRPRRATGVRASGAGQRGSANSSRKRSGASNTANDSDNGVGGVARSRTAGGLSGGGRNA